MLKGSVGKIVENFSIRPSLYSENSLIDSLKQIREYRPLPYEVEKVKKLEEFFVDTWFSQRMRKKYDQLSFELFNLKRELEIDTEKIELTDNRGERRHMGVIKQEIPLIVYTRLEDKEWVKEFEYDDRYNKYKFKLSSKMPSVPLEVRKVGRDAIAHCYETYADALKTDVLYDSIKKNPDYAPHPKDSKLFVLWKPRPSDIHVEAEAVDRDPALILEYGKQYLVSTWTEPNEEPFMNILSVCKLDRFIENNNRGQKNFTRNYEETVDEDYEDNRDIFG